MSESVDGDLDRATQKAWRRFRRDLADRIADLGPSEVVAVTVESAFEDSGPGCAPYLRFRKDAVDTVTGEISGNSQLHLAHRLDKSARGRLVDIGWSQPRPKRGRSSFMAEVDSSHADKLAVMAVSALREVFGVAHPAFLAGDLDEGRVHDHEFAATASPIDELVAVMPHDREHLDQLVEQALVPVFGAVPIRDGDGDIPVSSGSARVFVHTLPAAPLIRIWAELVVQIADLQRARFETEVLNRDRPFAKFTLVGDRIIGQVLLPAAPFVPAHLTQTLEMMCVLADEVDDDLAIRVGGRRFLEPQGPQEPERREDSDVDGGMHPAMLTLLQLDAESPGSITPALAAKICQHDRELLLELIRWNEEQEIEWRTAREDARGSGEVEESQVCDYERKHAKRTVKLLRQALRYVMELSNSEHT